MCSKNAFICLLSIFIIFLSIDIDKANALGSSICVDNPLGGCYNNVTNGTHDGCNDYNPCTNDFCILHDANNDTIYECGCKFIDIPDCIPPEPPCAPKNECTDGLVPGQCYNPNFYGNITLVHSGCNDCDPCTIDLCLFCDPDLDLQFNCTCEYIKIPGCVATTGTTGTSGTTGTTQIETTGTTGTSGTTGTTIVQTTGTTGTSGTTGTTGEICIQRNDCNVTEEYGECAPIGGNITHPYSHLGCEDCNECTRDLCLFCPDPEKNNTFSCGCAFIPIPNCEPSTTNGITTGESMYTGNSTSLVTGNTTDEVTGNVTGTIVQTGSVSTTAQITTGTFETCGSGCLSGLMINSTTDGNNRCITYTFGGSQCDVGHVVFDLPGCLAANVNITGCVDEQCPTSILPTINGGGDDDDDDGGDSGGNGNCYGPCRLFGFQSAILNPFKVDINQNCGYTVTVCVDGGYISTSKIGVKGGISCSVCDIPSLTCIAPPTINLNQNDSSDDKTLRTILIIVGSVLLFILIIGGIISYVTSKPTIQQYQPVTTHTTVITQQQTQMYQNYGNAQQPQPQQFAPQSNIQQRQPFLEGQGYNQYETTQDTRFN